MKKIVGLNYLRAISALLVVFYHYTTRYLDIFYNMGAEASHIGLWWGCRAVPVFFMLSGLLTIYNLKPETTILSFETKRVIRLYPAYWVAILITTFTTYLFMPQLKVGLMPTLFNFTMLQGFVNITPVDGAYWTLRYEIWFYVIIGIILLINKFLKLKNIYEKICTIWLLAVLTIISLISFLNIPKIVLLVVDMGLMIKYAHTFIIGISLYYILKDRRNYLSYFNLILSFIIHTIQFSLGYTIFVIIVAVLIFVIMKKEISFKYDKILLWISEISFPLYLVHQNVGYTIIYHFEKLGVGIWPGIISAFFVSVILAYLINICVEKPVLKLYRNIKTKEIKVA